MNADRYHVIHKKGGSVVGQVDCASMNAVKKELRKHASDGIGYSVAYEETDWHSGTYIEGFAVYYWQDDHITWGRVFVQVGE